jgi:hypothetical protein
MLVTCRNDAFHPLQPEFLEFGAIRLELSGQLVDVVSLLVNGQTFYLDRVLDYYFRFLRKWFSCAGKSYIRHKRVFHQAIGWHLRLGCQNLAEAKATGAP